MEIFYGTIAMIDCRQVSFPVYTDACTVAGVVEREMSVF